MQKYLVDKLKALREGFKMTQKSTHMLYNDMCVRVLIIDCNLIMNYLRI